MELKQQSIIDFKEPEDNRKRQKATPMMLQYLEVKDRHKEYLLFYRMGDFYELFFEDAKIAAKDLGIALTKRGKLDDEDIPMCGVPYHSVQTYLSRLIKLGHKIAIAEQFENKDQQNLDNKPPKIISRDVVRIITPGTLLDETILDSKNYNFLASVFLLKGELSAAWVDMTTGVFKLKNLNSKNFDYELFELLHKVNPREIITTEIVTQNKLLEKNFQSWKDKITLVPETSFDKKNNIHKLKTFFKLHSLNSLNDLNDTGICAAGALISYLQLTQKDNIPNILDIDVLKNNQFMEVDYTSSQSLELFQRINGERKGSLLDTIDFTVSPSGARMLKEYLKNPLLDKVDINKRLDYVEVFVENNFSVEKIREALKGAPDLDRTLSRVSANTNNPKDMLVISNFIEKSNNAFNIILSLKENILSNLVPDKGIRSTMDSLYSLINKNISEFTPISVNDGGVIKNNVSEELDKLRNIKEFQKKEIIKLQLHYSEATGINNLRIKFNNIHGYFIETNNKNAPKLLESEEINFQLVQNTLNASRFQTEELKKISIDIDNSVIKAIDIEKKLYSSLCNKVLEIFSILNQLSKSSAYIDVLTNYAFISVKRNYCRPIFNNSKSLEIVQGRHPVVEESLRKNGNQFISNDCILKESQRTWLMTGPNMAGKSTFLRQVAVITIMSQIGCFVPAKSVNMSVIDKIYTRVGASDDLSQGLSTFMTEMVETSRILRGATENSLVILDELGRGTSNSDGLSIAWAVLEFILKKKKCLTLFATHYKELTDIKEKNSEIILKTLQTKEWEGSIVFMYNVINGVSKSSYGLHVAKLAGIHNSIINRAKEILKNISSQKDDILIDSVPFAQNSVNDDGQLEKYFIIKNVLDKIDPNEVSPKEALELLYNIKKKIS